MTLELHVGMCTASAIKADADERADRAYMKTLFLSKARVIA